MFEAAEIEVPEPWLKPVELDVPAVDLTVVRYLCPQALETLE